MLVVHVLWTHFMLASFFTIKIVYRERAERGRCHLSSSANSELLPYGFMTLKLMRCCLYFLQAPHANGLDRFWERAQR